MSAQEINNNIDSTIDSMWGNAVAILQAAMIAGESKAKVNAPWTDRTAAARNSISAQTVVSEDNAIGYLGIGVNYGKYLELANGGKYRIISPTLFGIESYLRNNLKRIPLKGGAKGLNVIS